MGATCELTKPCAKCPWRADVPNYLRRGRRREILRGIELEGKDFHCHKTVDYSKVEEDEDGERSYDEATAGSSLCAGATLFFLRQESEPAGQMARITLRLDRKLAQALVADKTPIRSRESWVNGPDGDTNEPEAEEELPEPRVCCVVDHGCTAPAGWGGFGGFSVNDDADAEHDCHFCGDPVCDNCSITLRGGKVVCANCAEQEGII